MDTTGQAGSSARIHGAPNGPPMKCARKVQGGFAVGCSRKLRLRPSRLARANHIVRRTTKLLFGKRKTGRDENHTSERNILVGDFRGAAGRSATSTVRIVCRRGVAFEVIAPTSAGTSTSAGPRPGRGSAFGAATQHAEVAGDNLKAGALLAFLVLPFAGLDAAFDEDQRTLLKILLSNFSLCPTRRSCATRSASGARRFCLCKTHPWQRRNLRRPGRRRCSGFRDRGPDGRRE